MSTKPVSSVISNVSRPLKRAPRARAGTRRGSSPRTASEIARVCSGVEPQHEPAMFQEAVARELVQHSAEVTSGVSS